MDVTKFLDYGVLGLLTFVLLGVGWGLKLVFARWLDQMDAGIRTQDASAEAMQQMANAMVTLTRTVAEHSLATMTEHRLIIEELAKQRKIRRAGPKEAAK